MSRTSSPSRSFLKRTDSEVELDKHRFEAPSTRTRASSPRLVSAEDRHSPEPQAEAIPSETHQDVTSSSRLRQSPVDSPSTAEPLDWPDPNLGEFPSDLVVVPLTDPLSVPLNVEPEHFLMLDTNQWSIKHPTKVEIKNLVELEDDPVVIVDQYRLEPQWQDEFGLQVVIHLTYGDARSAKEACMLGVVDIPKLGCTFSVAPITYELDETTLMRREEYDKLQRIKREEVMRRLSGRHDTRDEGALTMGCSYERP